MARTATRATLVAYARQMAARYGIDPDIFVRQIDQESGFQPDAHSPAGAVGVAQFMPETARAYGIDPTEPYQSLDAAARYMRDALKANGGDYRKALAAYNAGQGAVDKYADVPPFEETQHYVRTILGAGGTMKGPMQAGDTGATTGSTRSAGNRSAITPEEAKRLSAGTSSSASPSSNEILAALQAQAQQLSKQIDDLTEQSRQTDADGTATASARRAHDDLLKIVPQYRVVLESIARVQATQTKQDDQAPTIRVFGDGTTRQYDPAKKDDPKTNGWVTIDPGRPTEKPTVRDFADNTTRRVNPDGSTTILAGERSLASGVKQTYNTQTGKWEDLPGQKRTTVQTIKAPSGAIHYYDPDTDTWPVLFAADQADVEAKNLANAKTQRDLLPAYQKLFADAQGTVDYIAAQWKSGRISQADADRTMENVWKSVDAAIAGTTLFQQEQDRANRKQAAARLGGDLLNQRVSSGASLAETILNVIAQKVRMPEGQSTLGLDPFAMSYDQTTRLGGGQDVYDQAKAMLLGAGFYPTTREEVIRRYPHLGGDQAQPAATQQAAAQPTPYIAPRFSNSMTNMPPPPAAIPPVSNSLPEGGGGVPPTILTTAAGGPGSGQAEAGSVTSLADELRQRLSPDVAEQLLAAARGRGALE